MGKIDIFKYEEQRLKNVIALINNKIKYTQKPKLCILIAGNAK